MNNIVRKINELKAKRKAVILVHNYQPPEIQDIADFLGDSLGLSRQAAETDAEVIVFCGVHFMAETAYILSPQKTVLVPDVTAGCPMADMIDAEKLRKLKKEHPDAVVVAYVNTTAEVKAESDICCTSANAVKVVNSIPASFAAGGDAKKIIFVPDKYLGQYVASQVSKPATDSMAGKEIILWEGYCPIHANISPDDISREKEEHPEAKVIVHPECIPGVISLADEVLSTSGMCKYAQKENSKEFIVGTEVGIIYRLQKENPGKKFYPASKQAMCENMKKNTLEKVLRSLENMKHEIKVEEHIRQKAKEAIDKMLEFSSPYIS